jgi:hypothetical protein
MEPAPQKGQVFFIIKNKMQQKSVKEKQKQGIKMIQLDNMYWWWRINFLHFREEK